MRDSTGIGMILSGGCSGSTWYRVGEGAIRAFIVLTGFAMGATATSVGILTPLRQTLQAPEVTVGGLPPTLASLVGLPPWLIIDFKYVDAESSRRCSTASPFDNSRQTRTMMPNPTDQKPVFRSPGEST